MPLRGSLVVAAAVPAQPRAAAAAVAAALPTTGTATATLAATLATTAVATAVAAAATVCTARAARGAATLHHPREQHVRRRRRWAHHDHRGVRERGGGARAVGYWCILVEQFHTLALLLDAAGVPLLQL